MVWLHEIKPPPTVHGGTPQVCMATALGKIVLLRLLRIILLNGTIVLPTALLPQRYPRLAAGNLEANALLVDEVSSNGSIAVPTALSQLSRLCYRRTGGRGHQQRNSTRSPKQRGLFIQLPPPPSLPPPGARPGLRPRCQRGTALSILGSGGSLLH